MYLLQLQVLKKLWRRIQVRNIYPLRRRGKTRADPIASLGYRFEFPKGEIAVGESFGVCVEVSDCRTLTHSHTKRPEEVTFSIDKIFLISPLLISPASNLPMHDLLTVSSLTNLYTYLFIVNIIMQVEKVTLVTGSSSGIGFETSIALAKSRFYTYATFDVL
jgi:hypothetical protein